MIDEKQSFQELYDILCIYRFSQYVNDLNIKLRGLRKTIDVMFDLKRALKIKLEVFKYGINTCNFKYFPSLQKYLTYLRDETPDSGRLQIQFLAVTDSTLEQSSLRFTRFRSFEETRKFIKCTDKVNLNELKLYVFQ